MQIKRLRLTGFKSFVEPSELRIEPGLTGIVGPNGCGKSNLLEAIRWVMGESSPKSMRGGGMDDVIFSGTSTRPSRDFAEVSLHCDTEGMLVAGLSDASDGDELDIIRRIDRGAGSAYRANGRDVRARDVALIFADAATGAHSPALVSQGKIAHIIAARPTERRAMLEEAAGIAGLHVRRKDAEQKLRATETNLGRLSEIIGDMEARAAALQRQARAAERYRQITSDIRRTEARLIFARWRDAAGAADQARSEADLAEATVIAAQKELEALSARQQQGAAGLAAHRSELQKQRVTLADISAHITRIESEERSVTLRLGDLVQQQQRLASDRLREDEMDEAAHQALSDLDSETKDLASQIAAKTLNRYHLVEADQRAHDHLRDADVALAQARAKAASETADRRIIQSAREAASKAAEKAASTLARIHEDRRSLGDSAKLVSAYQQAQQQVTEAEAAITAAEAALQSAHIRRENAAATLQQQDATLAQARAALAALLGEMDMLERAASAARSDGERLIDSISVDPGFEAALGAALGEDLNAGIDMKSPRHWRGADAPAMDAPPPPGTSSLADHVQAPDLLAPRLRHIFVADGDVADGDEDQPLAVGQRLVTRAGAMRRWDGFCTSGDGAAASDHLLRRNRLSALAQERPTAERVVAGLEADCTAAAKALADIQRAADQARASLTQSDAERRIALRAADQAQAALDRFAAAAALLDRRMGEGEAAHAEALAELSAQDTALRALPDDSHSRTAVQHAETANESARRLARESREILTAHDQDMAALSQRQAVVRAEIKSWKSRAGEAARRIADMEKRAASLAADVAMLAGQPEKLDRDKSAATRQRREVQAALSQAEAEEHRAEAELATLETALNQWRDEAATAREQRAGALARRENAEARRIEMGKLSGERFACPPPLLPQRGKFDGADVGEADRESAAHDRLIADRERLGPVNLVAADELAELQDARARNAAEMEELQQAVNRLRGSIGNLNREGRARLLTAFETVNGHFERLFASLFGGGQAHLELVDSDDPLEAGLEIMAQPPGKKLGTLTLLSGGEQALTAVALIFGLFLTNPAPICVLDEVDAPLDDANIERFCDLLDQMVQETRTRYLIVTHNAVTMARMHRLYGVTMVERGISRLVSVDLNRAEEFLAAE